MDQQSVQTVSALLPFVVLLIGFLVFKMNALKLSLYVWIFEIILVVFVFDMPIIKTLEASIWGNITIWNGFLVLWTGQIFGQCFRTTGALKVLLNTLERILPNKSGKAVAVCSVVGGYLGAFNGFATYPVTIPGLVRQGVDGFKAAVGYLVYFSWSVSFVSLFIAATIASTVTKLPVTEIVGIMGILTLPMIAVSVVGFFKILNFDLTDKHNRNIAILNFIANAVAVILFTQIFPDLYIVTLIAASTFNFLILWMYGKNMKTDDSEIREPLDTKLAVKAFLPLFAGSIVVVLFSYPLKNIISKVAFKCSLWGYSPISINLINTPGTYILITAILCYVFAINKTSTFFKDFCDASNRSKSSLITLFLGGAMVNLMVDTGQITLLAQHMTSWGATVYGLLLSGLGFLAGMSFGQGIPACAMFAKMQMASAQMLQSPAIILVGFSTMVTMGPANPLKPSLLQFTSSLANIKDRDGDMFNVAFKWQMIQLLIVCIFAMIFIK